MAYLYLCLALATAINVEGYIRTPPGIDRKTIIWANTRVMLDGQKTAFPDSTGYFAIRDVPPGNHVVEVHDPIYHYNTAVLEVSASSVTALEALAVRPNKLEYPLVFQAVRPISYFEKREGFSVMKLAMNPMVLMMGVMGCMYFFMPKLQLDPEQMAQLKEMQKEMKGGLFSYLQPS
mmetsp:Transcript_30303/g.53564  ORF Transcript_30303/g.53564 Transcript_30303/m.53564 type:complete len:177 (+) Transcript_30303:605-1135(+)